MMEACAPDKGSSDGSSELDGLTPLGSSGTAEEPGTADETDGVESEAAGDAAEAEGPLRGLGGLAPVPDSGAARTGPPTPGRGTSAIAGCRGHVPEPHGGGTRGRPASTDGGFPQDAE